MGHVQALLELEPKNINNSDYNYCCVIDLKQPCVP